MSLPWIRPKLIPSERNGTISVVSRLWGPSVAVNAYFQTGPYIVSMWRKALRSVPQTARIRRALILGYGAGGLNRLLSKKYPGVRITAIEWDPQMVALAKELQLHRSDELEDLRIGDAGHVVKEISGTFDLVIFDLYQGKEPSTLLEDKEFLGHIQRLLGRDGYFVVNVFRKTTAFETLKRFFSFRNTWRYRWNRGATYRNFGLGGEGDPLLPGFLPYHAIPALLEREVQLQPKQQYVRGNGYGGRRWNVGPVGFEVFYTDTEPVIEAGKGFRIIYWQPITRTDSPAGWRNAFGMHSYRKTGYARVGEGESYWKTWSAHAIRHRKKWLAAPDAKIAEVPVEQFIEAYRQGTLDWMTKRMFIWLLRRKGLEHGELLHCYLATNSSGRPMAGLAVLDIPEQKTALHVIAFYTKEARHSSVNYGLVDYWFRDAITKGWEYLDFDVFRGPGEPRSWEGYSRFKGQFDTRFILYPMTKTRIVWS